MSQQNAPQEPSYWGLTATQFNLAVFAVLGIIGLAAFIYTGGVGYLTDQLGGDEPSGSGFNAAAVSTPTATTEAPTGATPEEAAKAALLTLEDMPIGWSLDIDADDDDDHFDDFQFSEECAILNLEHPEGEIASAVSDDFEGPERQSVSSDSSVFASAEVARTRLQEYSDALSRCQAEWVDAFEAALMEEIGLSEDQARSAGLSVSFRDGPTLPALGDLMSTYRLEVDITVEGIYLHMIIDFVMIAEGRLVGGLNYFAVGEVDTLEEQMLVETLASKLEAANATLGE